MRLCRFLHQGRPAAGFYQDSHVVEISAAARSYVEATGDTVTLGDSDNLLDYLPPDGEYHQTALKLNDWVEQNGGSLPKIDVKSASLLLPIPRPNKLLLLAGNYAAHIEEGGEIARERAETFPYVFMKPPTTTLVDPAGPVRIPAVSPDHIDYELELAVVIGKTAKGVSEADALNYVAGYAVINDISDRKFRPNPNRKERPKDAFFDWLHGKWHDSFCPCGPCVTSADAVDDVQKLQMTLSVNGEIRQKASTGQQVFPVAAVVEFISSFVTLEPGDIISTGTPAGVGATTGTYLRAGDTVEAKIESIGTLTSVIE